jgi:hypothetical protein
VKPLHIDLHVHTAEGSACSEFCAAELADLARKKELEAVAITDHGSLEGLRAFRGLRPKPKARVLAGMELTTGFGDFLVFPPDEGLLAPFDGHHGGLLPFEKIETSGLPWAQTLLVWAHPFFPPEGALMPSEMAPGDLARVLALGPTIEGMNGQIRDREAGRRFSRRDIEDSMNGKAIRFAQERGLPIVYGSDAHTESAFHSLSTGFTVPIGSAADLAPAVKSGATLSKWEAYFPETAL